MVHFVGSTPPLTPPPGGRGIRAHFMLKYSVLKAFCTHFMPSHLSLPAPIIKRLVTRVRIPLPPGGGVRGGVEPPKRNLPLFAAFRIPHSIFRIRQYSVFAILYSVFLLAACTEPRKACLEIEATNFDAGAEENCCCVYPKLQIELLPRFDTLVWKPDTAYEYAPGKWFRLKRIVYYLSDFQLVQNGLSIPVSDTLAMKTWGALGDTVPVTLVNDFLLARRTTVVYTPGTFRTPGAFQAMHFRVGVPDAAQAVIPGLAPSGHPLQIQNEGLWLGRDTGYVALQLVLTRDTMSATPPDTLTINRPDFQSVLVDQTATLQHEGGYDFKIILTADYRALFANMDLSAGDISTWKTQLVANLPKIFRVSQ